MIFVSGGTGFIGSHSVKKLAAMGHRLRLLPFSGPRLATDLPQDQVEHVMGSITDQASLGGKMGGAMSPLTSSA